MRSPLVRPIITWWASWPSFLSRTVTGPAATAPVSLVKVKSVATTSSVEGSADAAAAAWSPVAVSTAVGAAGREGEYQRGDDGEPDRRESSPGRWSWSS